MTVWSLIAAVIRLKRGVHEVLSTLLLNFVGTLLVNEVADYILKGVQRGRYVILPGTGNRVLYRVISLLGDLTYSIVDDEWKTARQKKDKG